MQSTAFARLFYRSTARPAACRRAIDRSRSPLPDTLVAVMRAVDPAVGDAAFGVQDEAHASATGTRAADQHGRWCGASSRGAGASGGGARGADHYGLHAVVAAGSAACVRSVVFLTGRCQRGPSRSRVSWRWVAAWCRARGRGGSRGPRRAGSPSSGAVAGVGVHGAGGGPDGGKSAAVVLAGGGATLPSFPDGQVATDVYGIACRSLSR